MARYRFQKLLGGLALAGTMLLTACNGGDATPTSTPRPTPTERAGVTRITDFPSPEATPTATSVPTPVITLTPTATATPTATSVVITPTPTQVPTPTATITVSPTHMRTPTPKPSPTATLAPTPTPIPLEPYKLYCLTCTPSELKTFGDQLDAAYKRVVEVYGMKPEGKGQLAVIIGPQKKVYSVQFDEDIVGGISRALQLDDSELAYTVAHFADGRLAHEISGS